MRKLLTNTSGNTIRNTTRNAETVSSLPPLFLTLTALVMLLSFFGATPVEAGQRHAGRLTFGGEGGIMIPVTGDYSSADSSVNDVFDVGPSFGGFLRYGLIDALSIEAGFKYSFMKMKDEANGSLPMEPRINLPQIYLDGILNLGSLLGDGTGAVNPYLRAGGGVFPWKVTMDDINGDPQILANGNKFSKTSFGLNFGAGVELFATDKIAVYGQGVYHLIFTQDEGEFGSAFPDDLSFIETTGGVSYYFGL